MRVAVRGRRSPRALEPDRVSHVRILAAPARLEGFVLGRTTFGMDHNADVDPCNSAAALDIPQIDAHQSGKALARRWLRHLGSLMHISGCRNCIDGLAGWSRCNVCTHKCGTATLKETSVVCLRGCGDYSFCWPPRRAPSRVPRSLLALRVVALAPRAAIAARGRARGAGARGAPRPKARRPRGRPGGPQ